MTGWAALAHRRAGANWDPKYVSRKSDFGEFKCAHALLMLPSMT